MYRHSFFKNVNQEHCLPGCAVFSAAAFGLVGSNLSWGLAFPGLPASHLELESRPYCGVLAACQLLGGVPSRTFEFLHLRGFL